MKALSALCVYCGSSQDTRESHRSAAREFGSLLAQAGITLVFGGGKVGLMGLAANAALEAGGKVIGVIPDFLVEREVGHASCTELHITATMHERKTRMAELSDAFVILPGGLGTLDEAFEIITWKQLGLHDKPIVLANIDGYWDPFENMLDRLVEENYVAAKSRQLFQTVDTIDAVLPAIAAMPSSKTGLESTRI